MYQQLFPDVATKMLANQGPANAYRISKGLFWVSIRPLKFSSEFPLLLTYE